MSGSRREGVLSEAFKDLLKRWGKAGFTATVGIGHITQPLSDKLPAMIVAAVIALVIRVKEIKQISPVAWVGGPQL